MSQRSSVQMLGGSSLTAPRPPIPDSRSRRRLPGPWSGSVTSLTVYRSQSVSPRPVSTLSPRVTSRTVCHGAAVCQDHLAKVNCPSTAHFEHPSIGATTCSRNRRSEEHTSELQSLRHLVCRLL